MPESGQKQDIPFEKFKKIIDGCVASGALAATVTGGGEPTLYPHINEALEYCFSAGLEIGLVSNGHSLDQVQMDLLDRCTWIRVSVSDEFGLALKPGKTISQLVPSTPDVDWSFSYVVTRDTNYEAIIETLDFANQHDFTHVRLVSDLLDLEAVPSMDQIRSRISGRVDDKLAIYQGRKEYTRGQKKCYISLLKTVVAPDGKLYGCCGIQYCEEPPAIKYPDSMCMGDALDIEDIIAEQRMFDGSRCVRCYYSDYNNVLGLLLSENVQHLNFV